MHTFLVSYIFIAVMLLLPANINFILAVPIQNEPKTMFDVLAKKCPNLNETTLKDNDLFTKRCLKWDEINNTTQLTEHNKDNVECLVLYEAVLKFCIGIGDHILVKNLFPSTDTLQNSNNSLDQVCHTENGIYPKINTEHNISSLIHNSNDCFLLCNAYSRSRISDICIWSYFFTNFNTSKFTQDLDNILQQRSEVDKKNQVKDVPNSVGIVQSSKPIKAPSEDKAGKAIDSVIGPVSTTKFPPKLSPIQPQEAGLVDSQQFQQSQKPVVNAPAENHDDKSAMPGTQVGAPSLPGQKQDFHVEVSAVENEVKAGNSDKGVKDDQKIENARTPEPIPKQAVKPETNPEKAQQENDENEAYIDDKSQDDMADEDRDLDGEGEHQEGEIKNEPAVPDENSNVMKVASKKGKPANTVEDEAVSSFSLPEDDMDGDSYFFSYFTVIMCLFIVGYVGYHNRQKVLALILEGKKGRRPGRARRPNSANYHKLDSNLEEAISSSCTKNASNVIY